MKHILLADDDQDDVEFFQEALREVAADIHLTTVSNGIQLMHLLKEAKETFDLLVLDINMPLKNGFDCLQEIRSGPRFSLIPIALMSTSSDLEVRVKVTALGANAFYTKPSEFDQLVALIRSLIVQNWNEVK